MTPDGARGDARRRTSTAAAASPEPVAEQPVIQVTDLIKDYSRGERRARAAVVKLEVQPGEFVAVMGPSGSGKSTFMNLSAASTGRPAARTRSTAWKSPASRPASWPTLRNHKIGFIFQGFNLLPRMDALDNVMLPMVYAGVPTSVRQQRAQVALEAVGLGARMHHRPSELSGGQQQRVAIARALVNAPSLILADEPTGNLDSRTSVEIMAILQRLNQAGATIVLVTHEPDIASVLLAHGGVQGRRGAFRPAQCRRALGRGDPLRVAE